MKNFIAECTICGEVYDLSCPLGDQLLELIRKHYGEKHPGVLEKRWKEINRREKK